ncbi:hypothetical protein CHARACLAT_031731 [Characodon lateralis]|uniref:Uncharacterized protein n=1 Tax=Characodon lateralis TaxID=208331 RepID=A0ABU7DFE0_9TELE|nr:hypothetical protein [Characodon lateralis]
MLASMQYVGSSAGGVKLSISGQTMEPILLELRKALVALDHKQIQDTLISTGVEWSFNPPAGSHYGGVWEHSTIIHLIPPHPSNPPHPNLQTETKSFQTQGSHC